MGGGAKEFFFLCGGITFLKKKETTKNRACQSGLSRRSALAQRGDLVEHRRASKGEQRQSEASASGARQARRCSVEGRRWWMKPVETVLTEGRGGDESLLRRRRRAAPLFFSFFFPFPLSDVVNADSPQTPLELRLARASRAWEWVVGGGVWGGGSPRSKDKGGGQEGGWW